MGIQTGARHVRRSCLIRATPALQSYEAGWHCRHLEALEAIVVG